MATALALAVSLALGGGSAWAAVQYLDDGAKQNAQGGWDLPAQGTCPADTAQVTRPDCLALRIVAASSTACTAALGSWTTNGVCNDLVNNTQALCEAAEDRKWNAGTGVCAVVMKGDDRNNVVCALHQGTWVTTGTCIGSWTMPAGSTYTPNLITTSGPGDQCLRCHNSVTEYNGPRLRDVNWALRQGHKNMARKVVPGLPWGGPGYECTNPAYTTRTTCEANGGTWEKSIVIYPSDDSGNLYDWNLGQVTINGTPRELTWIYGDWLAPLPRSVAKLPASTSKVCSDPRYTTQATCEGNGGSWIFNAGASYSCGRCHTTGWTSDATVNTAKEPEKSFPGITWDRNTDAGFGVVNLAGGVSGDANRYSSWDAWGITCSRCHTSVVDNATPDPNNPGTFLAPTGMGRHHSDLTTFDVSTSGDRGYCTDSRFTAATQCFNAGAEWFTACSKPGACTDGVSTTRQSCVAGGGTWTIYNTSALCTAGGGSWPAASSCTVAGVCNNPAYTDQTSCTANGAQWAAVTDVIRCEDAGGHWTGTKANRGQIITSLCMDCHRQETGGNPYDPNNPAGALKVGPAHGTVGFVSHPHGNQFLNSPHGKFTGKFNQIGTGKFAFNMTGEYKSWFMTEGEAANTGNGCTGCHDVHKSVVEEAFEPAPDQEGAIKEECTACHNKNLNLVLHPTGAGTPLEEMHEEPYETCVSCHMPEGMHLWRINVDPDYSTFPAGALTATVNANTAASGNYPNAVWADVDHACGQCHGGGTGTASTTGSINSGSKVLTVADTTGFTAGQKIRVADAGALDYDDEGLGRGDFETYIVSVAPPTTINLAGAPSMTVAGKEVVQNATKNAAGYMTKTQLAALARGMHNDKPVATFGYTIGSPNTLVVNVDASASRCSGDIANCDAFEWDWGDGTTGTGVTASHTYLDPNTYEITLTVEEYGVGGGSVTRDLTVYQPDLPPTGVANCTWEPNTWTLTVADGSTDDNGVKQVTVNWGDGSMLASDLTVPFGPFSRTYANAGTYTATHKAIDTIGQQAVSTCAAVSPAYFTIGGTVFTPASAPLGSAMVQIKKGTTVVKTVYTAANGTFTATGLKPATYTLTVTKSPYIFTVPAATVMVGPSDLTVTIGATGPYMVNNGGGSTGGRNNRVQKP
jgi:PKD repeat protein